MSCTVFVAASACCRVASPAAAAMLARFLANSRLGAVEAWSNGWHYAHEEPSSAPQALAQSFTTARVTRRENSGSPCGESWTAQGSRSPIWTSLVRWCLLRGLTGRQSNADWSSVWCRPRGRSRSWLLAERVGLTLSPARTWARSSWTPTHPGCGSEGRGQDDVQGRLRIPLERLVVCDNTHELGAIHSVIGKRFSSTRPPAADAA